MNNVDKTLEERGKVYGKYRDHAYIADNIRYAMLESPNWRRIDAEKRHSLIVIADKIGRILSGDPNHIDSWHDIIGYARLIEVDLELKQVIEVTEEAIQPRCEVNDEDTRL